ncbi:MAG: hypothetical protein KBH07_08755 [Flavobacteriales bacterium]|nr:hypothetical protein [Flavobacteriales bacterium]MBP9079938.1 hypothetical protein [Flavobacteriales bacterium]
MEFVRAGQVKLADHSLVTVILKVMPLTDDFKLVLSMRVGYDMGNGAAEVDVEKGNNIRFTVYDTALHEMSKKLRQFIAARTELKSKKNFFLLRMDFRVPRDERVERMKLQYGLWEGKNDEIRHEQMFDFVVEDARR